MKDIIGLAVLAWPLTLLILIGLTFLVVIPLAVGYAARHGRSKWRWGIGAFLLVYLPIFWDWIPTVAVHQFYCAKDSGFWVYKTLDQWKGENQGVMEGLVDNSPNAYPNWPSESWNGQRIASINQRFGMLYKDHLSNSEEGELFLNVWRWKTELVDKNTGEVLARQVDFSTGNGYIGGEPPMKFWLQSDGCIGGKGHSKSFGEFLKQFRGAKK